MGVTAGGLPYPEPTEPVAGGAAAIKALAEALDAGAPRAVATGHETFASTAVGAVGSKSVTFPAGRFTLPPRVTMASVTGAPNTRIVGCGTSSASAVTLYAYNGGGGPVTPVAYWHAVQDRTQTTARAGVESMAGETFGWVVCPTEGCLNRGVPLEVQTAWVDDDGTVYPVDAFGCGVCGTPLEPTDDPPGFGVPE